MGSSKPETACRPESAGLEDGTHEARRRSQGYTRGGHASDAHERRSAGSQGLTRAWPFRQLICCSSLLFSGVAPRAARHVYGGLVPTAHSIGVTDTTTWSCDRMVPFLKQIGSFLCMLRTSLRMARRGQVSGFRCALPVLTNPVCIVFISKHGCRRRWVECTYSRR